MAAISPGKIQERFFILVLFLCVNDIEGNICKQSNCSPLLDKSIFPCVVGNTETCNEYGKNPWTGVNSNPPDVQYIGLYNWTSRDGVTHLALNITWVPNTRGLSVTKGYKLKVNGKNKHAGSSYIAQEPCRLFDFRNSSLTDYYAKNHTITFSYHCMIHMQYEGLYSASITGLPGANSREFTIQIPKSTSFLSRDPSVWQTVVSVATDFERKQIIVLFQEAALSMNISSYNIILHNVTRGSRRVPPVTLAKGIGKHVFNNIALGGYIVGVIANSLKCQGKCPESKNTIIHMEKMTSKATKAPVIFPTTSMPPLPLTTENIGKRVETDSVMKEKMKNSYSISAILGTVFGLAGAATLIFLLFLCIRKDWCSWRAFTGLDRFNRMRESDNSITLDQAFMSLPKVLVLYSYDCPAHENVICAFCMYLKEVCNCEVSLDLWEQTEIQEKGPFPWFQDRLDAADFVLVVCSTGARFKCTQKNKFSLKQDHPIADVFVTLVDMVAENVRIARNEGKGLDKYIPVYFDYSTDTDVPPKLDLEHKYGLMKDMFLLYAHLHKTNIDNIKQAISGVMADNYMREENGKILQTAINSAMEYFRQNPNWLSERLLPISETETANKTPAPKILGWNGHKCRCKHCHKCREEFKMITDRDKQCFMCFSWKTQTYNIDAFKKADTESGCYPALPQHRCPVPFPEMANEEPPGKQGRLPKSNHTNPEVPNGQPAVNGIHSRMNQNMPDDDSILQRDIDFIKNNIVHPTDPNWVSPDNMSINTTFSSNLRTLNAGDKWHVHPDVHLHPPPISDPRQRYFKTPTVISNINDNRLQHTAAQHLSHLQQPMNRNMSGIKSFNSLQEDSFSQIIRTINGDTDSIAYDVSNNTNMVYTNGITDTDSSKIELKF